MNNSNNRQLPFCLPGVFFIYMGASRIIGMIVSSVIYSAYYGMDMEYMLKANFNFFNFLQISVLIALGVFLLIRKFPIVNTVLFGVMSLLPFFSLRYADALTVIDNFFTFGGYALLCLISLGVFTNFKAMSKVWFLPIILFLAIKPFILINTITNGDYLRPTFLTLITIFSFLISTAVLAVTVILLCKWYKKVIASISDEPVYTAPVQPTYVQPVYTPVQPVPQMNEVSAAVLKEYQQLLTDGKITVEEYEAKRKQLLNL